MSDVYVCMHKHTRIEDLGACSPSKFLEISCSEIDFEVTTFWDRSGAIVDSYMAHGVLCPIFGCPHMHLLAS